MAQTYFGGAEGNTPIVPTSTVDWSTVNPPEVQAQAWEFENARREAERQREIQDQLQQSARVGDSIKAIEAAQRFQGMRRYQADLAAGKTPQEALVRNAPLMFTKPTAGMLAGPKPAAEIIERDGQKFIQQPSGSLVRIPMPTAATDAEERRLRADIARAQTSLASSERAAAGTGATMEKIIQPGALRTLAGKLPWISPAVPVTNRVAIAKPEVVAKTGAVRDEAQRQLDAANSALENYLGQKGQRVASPAGLPAAAAPVISAAKSLTKELATDFLMQAKGDRALARKLAREAGYTF